MIQLVGNKLVTYVIMKVVAPIISWKPCFESLNQLT